jgi:hypothetical protein
MIHGRLSEAQAILLAAAGPEAVRLALLAANARIAQLQLPVTSPSTPSGGVAVFFGKWRYDGRGGISFRRPIWTRKSSSGS